MRKILSVLIVAFWFCFLSVLFPKITLAATCDLRTDPPALFPTGEEVKLIFNVSEFTEKNFLCSFPGTWIGNPPAQRLNDNEVFCTWIASKAETRTAELLHENKMRACVAEFTVNIRACQISVIDPDGKHDINSRFDIEITDIYPYGGKLEYHVEIKMGRIREAEWFGRYGPTFSETGVGPFPMGTHEITVHNLDDAKLLCRDPFRVVDVGETPPTPGEEEYRPCERMKEPEKTNCENCLDGTTLDGKLGSWTALGCIPNDPRDFVAWLLARAIGIGGGIAFLLMIWGGFQVITAAGDPDRLNAGKEIITSAIAGLLLIIFSLFLLELIGVDILGLKEVGFEFGGG